MPLQGKVVFSPIEDETNVDIRREEMNMPSLDFYLKIMEKMYGIKEHPEIKNKKDRHLFLIDI